MTDPPPDRFRYDFNSPYAYLAASRIDAVLGADVAWEPIAFAFVLRAHDREPWSFHEPSRTDGMRECERRAEAYGLAPLRWPPGWPVESYTLASLRAAWAAQRIGQLRAFSAAAFARNFVDGVGLNDAAMIDDVCERAGIDAREVRAGLDGYGRDRLRAATDAAIAEGVLGVPTVTIAGTHFWGDDRLEDAALAPG
jgi:2-hydroxychromene-2-carboxylate isomerase